jgi:hypothetical protein
MDLIVPTVSGHADIQPRWGKLNIVIRSLRPAGVNFGPTFYDLQDEQRGKAAVWSQKNEMLPMNLNPRGNHEMGIQV